MVLDTAFERIDGSGLRFLIDGERERPRAIVLLLHGSGSHAHNIRPVATALAARLPGVQFVIPNAPQSYRDTLSGARIAATERANPGMDWENWRTWAAGEGGGDSPEARLEAVFAMMRPPVKALNRLADLVLARHGLPDTALALYGFSQGGLVAVNVGLDRATCCAGVVCHSGHFLGAPPPRSLPRMLVMVGSDEILPTMGMSQFFPFTVEGLRELGVPVEEHVCAGLGHAFNDETVTRSAHFLTMALSAN